MIEMTILLHEIIEMSESIRHDGFKISYDEISYTVTVDQSTVAGFTGVERVGGNGKRQGINRQHEIWIEWKGESTYRSPTFQRFYSSSESESSSFNFRVRDELAVAGTVPMVYSYRATRELSCGSELPNRFHDRSRWLSPCQEKIL
jgi:hypothetical protein